MPSDSRKSNRIALAVKIAMSGVAGSLIIARILFPDLTIDAIAIGLLALAVLPWLHDLKSIELPGVTIHFKDVAASAAAVIDEPGVTAGLATAPSVLVPDRPHYDANVTLVWLRIEIEKRVRALCEKHNISAPHSLRGMLNALGEKEVLGDSSLQGLHELVIAGNMAARGASVESSIGPWAREYGPGVLGVLDAKLSEKPPPPKQTKKEKQ